MTCQLVFLTGERAGTAFPITKTPAWCGRDPRCELAFDPQRNLTISGWHAQIVHKANAYYLIDASTNGTFLNGQKIDGEVPLSEGDIMELGPGGPRLRFSATAVQGVEVVHAATVAAQPGMQPQQPVSPTAPIPTPGQQPIAAQPTGPQPPGTPAAGQQQPMVAQPPTVAQPAAQPPTVAQPAAQAQAPAPGAAAPPPTMAPLTISPASSFRVSIVLQRVPGGQQLSFDKPVIRIGRDQSADIPFDAQTDLLVSYNHAKIMMLEGKAVIFDSESTNGVFINSQRINRHDLQGGEEVEFGQGGPRLLVVSISAEEVAAPQTVAGRQVPGGDTVFGGAAPQINDLSLGDAELLGEYPVADRILIGRDQSNTIVLDSMFVSSRHALIERRGEGVFLRDAGSANGVYLGGERVVDSQMIPGTEFVVGPYVLKFTGAAVLVFDTRTSTWVDAFDLTFTDQRTRRDYLDHISLKIQPGEFICIMGPSGCGKSTLLKGLNGCARASSGVVMLNNIDFYANYEQLKHQVGYVPQDDIIHPQLSIWRTLVYAAKLRLPPGTSGAERTERIKDVLSVLELYDHRNKPIHKLSGGQRKRVSIGVELLTDPAIIYLDEPTSGLDPNLEEKMMLLFREMTLRGKTVATVTHTLDNIHLADKVTFLVDGKLAFFGTQQEAAGYFQVERMPEVYKRFEERRGDLDAMRDEFKASPIYQQHVATQLGPRTQEATAAGRKPTGKKIGPGTIKQFLILTSRYAEIITRDMRNTAILLIQAPLVALFILLAVKTDMPERGPTSTMFLIMSLSALWFGCSNAAREITKEASIFSRERMVNLKILPYVASKFFVLQFLALVQVSTMLVIVYFARSGYILENPPHDCVQDGIQACSLLILDGVPGGFWPHLLNLYLTALNGIGLGLLISALAGNSDKAMSIVPLVLIPQVLFSGSFGVPQADEYVKRGVGYAMSLNWSLDQAKRIAMCEPKEERSVKKGGDGCTTCLHAMDPFKHKALKKTAQIPDTWCKALLPMEHCLNVFPEYLREVEDGLYTPPSAHGKGKPRDATKSFIGYYVMGGYNLLLFILICIFVRVKKHKT